MNNLDLMLDNIEAVLFDVDGTLIDSMGIWKEVDRIYLSRYGIEMEDDFQEKLAGLSIMQTADYFREVVGIPEPPEKMLAAWNELAMEQYKYHIKIKEYVYEFLDEVKKRGIKMGVCTSNTTSLAHTVLNRMHLTEYMSTIITGEDIIDGKPNPYIYLEAARRIGADPSKCLVFEDIPEGAMAGRNAGMKVCSVYDEFSSKLTEEKKALSDYYINSFKDIFNDEVEVLK